MSYLLSWRQQSNFHHHFLKTLANFLWVLFFSLLVRTKLVTYEICDIFKTVQSSANSWHSLLRAYIPCGSDGKESACNAGDPGSTPGSGRSPGEGSGNGLQFSCLENSMNREALQAAVDEVAKSQTWLSNLHFHTHRASQSWLCNPAALKCISTFQCLLVINLINFHMLEIY